jgi:hypothetical protein
MHFESQPQPNRVLARIQSIRLIGRRQLVKILLEKNWER